MTEMEIQLTNIIQNQSRQIESLNEKLSKALEQNETLVKSVKDLQEAVNYLTKKRFGASSEKSIPGQATLFDETSPFFKKQR